jgi:hypothetical protein
VGAFTPRRECLADERRLSDLPWAGNNLHESPWLEQTFG